MVQQIFPKETVILDHVSPDMTFSSSKREMQLDVFVPTLKVAFEYQGFQHYHFHYLYQVLIRSVDQVNAKFKLDDYATC